MDKLITLPGALTVIHSNPAHTIIRSEEEHGNEVVDEAGFQLHDIVGLLPERQYLPPISIPFLGVPAGNTHPVDYVKYALAWSFADNLAKREKFGRILAGGLRSLY